MGADVARIIALVLTVLVTGMSTSQVRALVPELSAAQVKQAVAEGDRARAREDYDEEWRVRLSGGEEVVVTTPFARLVHAVRQAALRDQSLDERQLQEELERSKGKLQLTITMYGRRVDFARWYVPTLMVDKEEIKASFVQNERTALRLDDGRYAARNVYVFPLDGLPPKGKVTLVVQHGIEKSEVLRASLDLGRMR